MSVVGVALGCSIGLQNAFDGFELDDCQWEAAAALPEWLSRREFWEKLLSVPFNVSI